MYVCMYLFVFSEKKENSSSGYLEKKFLVNITSQWEVSTKQSKHILGTIYIKSQIGFLKTSVNQ